VNVQHGALFVNTKIIGLMDCMNPRLYSKEKRMDIEVIEGKEDTPFKELLNFLNKEIYSRMSKKDVKAIKENGSLGGSLDRAIRKYKDACVIEALKKERENHERDNKTHTSKNYSGTTGTKYRTVY